MGGLGKTIAVLGGDRRMLEAVRRFAQSGADVRVTSLPGSDRVPGVRLCATGSEALKGANVAVLPVQGLSGDGRIFVQQGAPDCHLTLDGLLGMVRGATVFSGIGNAYLRALCQEAGTKLVEYREADEFAIWNSIPSAEGAIQMAMESTPFTLFGSRTLVLGFGRTGKALALLLKGLNSQVTVLARNPLDFARAWAAGYLYTPWEHLEEAVAGADVIFNTVPAMILTRDVLRRAPEHAVIIDVASAPGGTDFAAADDLGLIARLAPGLPGIVAPVTAGKIIADLILRHLENSEREGEVD